MKEKAENSNESNSRTKVYGSKLKSARVSLQKTIEEIAAELNLHKNIIISIEEMDEKNLPSAVFVKGYIRTYAKFVQIASEDLIKDYSDVDETEVVIEIAKNKSKNKNEFNFEPNFKISLAVIIIIILLLSFFSFNNFENTKDSSRPETEVQDTALIEEARDELLISNNENEMLLNENEESNQELKSLYVNNIVKNESAEENEISRQNEIQKRKASLISETEIDTTTSSEGVNKKQILNDIVADSVVEKLKEDLTIEKTNIDYKNGLLIIANEDSWMEIRDNAHKRVFSNVLEKGEQKYFTGSNHYKLIIGRSNAVSIKYLDKPVDFYSYAKPNGISRFDITKEGLSDFSVPKKPKKETPVKDLEI